MAYESRLQQIRHAKKPELPVIPESAPVLPVASSAKPNHAEHYAQQLEQDKARLKAIEAIPAKNLLKREMVDNYSQLIKDFLAGSAVDLKIVTEIMIWLFDIAEIETALKTAFLLIEKNQPMPERFKWDMKTFVCRSMGEWARPLCDKKLSASPYLEWLVEKMDADFWDLLPQSASEIYVLLAKFKYEAGEFSDVVALCDKAIAANPDGHGCKTLRARAQNESKKQAV